MKTIIPNQLKFDLNLNDLPARAESVSSAALSLSGSKDPSLCEYVDTGMENIDNSRDTQITPETRSGSCHRWCIQEYGSRFCASPGADGEDHFPGALKPDGYQSWLCLCYKKGM